MKGEIFGGTPLLKSELTLNGKLWKLYHKMQLTVICIWQLYSRRVKLDQSNPWHSPLGWKMYFHSFLHHYLVSYSWITICLKHSYFKIWLWKSKVELMGEAKGQDHRVGLASYWVTSLSFHANWTTHSWDKAISKFDLENEMVWVDMKQDRRWNAEQPSATIDP